MKRIFWMTLCYAVLTSPWLYPQNGETTPKQGYGYALFTPGATVGDGGAAATLTIGAGAERLIKRSFGAGADCLTYSIQAAALTRVSDCFLPVSFTNSIRVARQFPLSQVDIRSPSAVKRSTWSTLAGGSTIGSTTIGVCASKFATTCRPARPNTICCSFVRRSCFGSFPPLKGEP